MIARFGPGLAVHLEIYCGRYAGGFGWPRPDLWLGALNIGVYRFNVSRQPTNFPAWNIWTHTPMGSCLIHIGFDKRLPRERGAY